MELTFEWDEGKAQENFTKHKIRFEEGKTVFNDPFLWTLLASDFFASDRAGSG
jgi:uncharacterized DUF497 family protein